MPGIVASQTARAVRPYVLQLGHCDREDRLGKGGFVLVSQTVAENAELSIVGFGKKIPFARKQDAK